jgi:hypothetical protein
MSANFPDPIGCASEGYLHRYVRRDCESAPLVGGVAGSFRGSFCLGESVRSIVMPAPLAMPGRGLEGCLVTSVLPCAR